METYLSKDVQAGLEAARKKDLKRNSRWRVVADGESHKVLRHWRSGIALDAKTAPHLRGLIDLYNGQCHVCRCLIVASQIENGEMIWEFKRSTPVSVSAARDFFVEPDAPVALIENTG